MKFYTSGSMGHRSIAKSIQTMLTFRCHSKIIYLMYKSLFFWKMTCQFAVQRQKKIYTSCLLKFVACSNISVSLYCGVVQRCMKINQWFCVIVSRFFFFVISDELYFFQFCMNEILDISYSLLNVQLLWLVATEISVASK